MSTPAPKLLRAVPGASLLSDLAEPASAIERAVMEAALDDLPELEAWLARVGGLVRVRYVREPQIAPPSALEDRLLTVEEAARRLGVTKGWLYQNHRGLPFTRRLGRQHLRFSMLGLEDWIRVRGLTVNP